VREPLRSSTPSTVSWRESLIALSAADWNAVSCLLELGGLRLRLVGLQEREEPRDRRVRLGLVAGHLLGGAVLRLEVAVLDVEVLHDAIAVGHEVLAHRHQLLQGAQVVVGHAPGAVVDLADAAQADHRRDHQGEDEEPERDAEAHGQPKVEEARHGPPYRRVGARLKRLTI
jgi:hypothetical protein